MRADEHDRVLARVRHRFVTSIEGRIKTCVDTFSRPSLDEYGYGKSIDETYRRLHEIAAIGPTVGFRATAKAARAAEVVLLEAHLSGRGITASEATSMRKALDALWASARNELGFL